LRTENFSSLVEGLAALQTDLPDVVAEEAEAITRLLFD
jgi:hypothetical protein